MGTAMNPWLEPRTPEFLACEYERTTGDQDVLVLRRCRFGEDRAEEWGGVCGRATLSRS